MFSLQFLRMLLYSPHTSSFLFANMQKISWRGGRRGAGGEVAFLEKTGSPWFGVGRGELTGGHAGWITNDRCWCHSVQISYGVQLGKALSTKKKSPIKKKSVLIFLFFSSSPPLSEVCSSFMLFSFSNLHSFFLDNSIPRSLQEADRPDIDSKLLVCSTDIHGCNVQDGQTRGLLWSVFNHRLAPFSRVSL